MSSLVSKVWDEIFRKKKQIEGRGNPSGFLSVLSILWYLFWKQLAGMFPSIPYMFQVGVGVCGSSESFKIR